MKKLLNEAIESIKPDKNYEKEILEKANSIIKKINSSLKDAKVVLGGSGAKGTWLKTFDVDIFVKFNYEKFKGKSNQISDILEKSLKKHFKIIKLHGSRDYFQIKQKDFTFEIIPILNIKKSGQAKNITDVSPLHSNFIKKHKKLANEIRLTKQFFKAAKVYGAESHIKGFSGYVCEILTIHYGSFLKLMKEITKWKEKSVIDVENYYKGKNVFMEVNKSKLVSPLIVIDPVQKDRNAAAALDKEKFGIIKSRAKEFLKKPSKEFFEIKTLSEKDLKKKAGKNKLIILKAEPLKKKEDIAGAKMLKAFHFIENNIVSNAFEVIESDMVWNLKSSLFYYILKNDALPNTLELSGPPLKIKPAVISFKKKHKNTFTKGKRIFAKEKRKFTKAKQLINSLIKKTNVKDNLIKIKII